MTSLLEVQNLKNVFNNREIILSAGIVYRGFWDAETNEAYDVIAEDIISLASSVGVEDNYYLVVTEGATNLNGVTDWTQGSWALFQGGVWTKSNEDEINTDNIPQGSTNQYFTETAVRNTDLLGFIAVNSAIVAGNTILEAFGKAQGQIDDIRVDIAIIETDISTIETDITALQAQKLNEVPAPDGAVNFNNQNAENIKELYVNDHIIAGASAVQDSGFFHNTLLTNKNFFAVERISDTNALTLRARRARGSGVGSESAVQANDQLFTINCFGWNGSGYNANGSSWRISADETFSGSTNKTKEELRITITGTSTALQRIQDFNGLTLGNTTAVGSVDLYLKSAFHTGINSHAASTTSLASGNIPTGTAPTSPSSGDYWHSSTQKALRMFLDGLTQTFPGIIFTASAGATVGNTTTETSLIGTGIGSVALPASFYSAGKYLRIKAKGFISNTGTPTIRIRVKLGSTAILDTTATTMVTITGAMMFEIHAEILCRTTGASGSVIGQGVFIYYSAAGTPNYISMVNTTTTTIDTTAGQVADVTAEWGTIDPSNTMTATQSTFEVLN